ncbi:MAG: hypothetical protein AAF487_02075 [Bacteroidota bacterium]
MKVKYKILLIAAFFALVLSPDKICNHLGFGQDRIHQNSGLSVSSLTLDKGEKKGDYFVNDTLLKWDEKLFDWKTVELLDRLTPRLYANFNADETRSEAVEVEWQTLIDIQFILRYFEDLDIELYAPVFSEAVENLNGKQIVIEGFVIPFDEEEELFALSSYPYASCFFCGRASPASILSMQMKENSESYKLDAFKKFKGTLYLNYDDPDEFCYVLRNAEEI